MTMPVDRGVWKTTMQELRRLDARGLEGELCPPVAVRVRSTAPVEDLFSQVEAPRLFLVSRVIAVRELGDERRTVVYRCTGRFDESGVTA